MLQKFVSLHLETQRAELMELEAVKVTDSQIQGHFRQAFESKEISAVLHRFIKFVENSPLVVYNWEPLYQSLFRQSDPGMKLRFTTSIYDLLELGLLVLPSLPNHRLDTLGKKLGLREYVRAELVAKTFLKLQETLEGFPSPLLGELLRLSRQTGSTLQPLIAQAAEKYPQGPFHLLQIVEPISPVRLRSGEGEAEISQLDMEEIKSIFLEGGKIARNLPNYEYRPQQVDMSEGVCEAFNQGRILLAEAGTGVGKSMAYLVPAIFWSKRNARRVLISTNTKNLQEQLYNKDIPFLLQALEVDFKPAILKGRNNYLCLRRFASKYEEVQRALFSDSLALMPFLISWIYQTDSGDLSELSQSLLDKFPALKDLQEDIQSEGSGCLGRQCPWSRRCFVEKARRGAEEADIIVVNHSLVFAGTKVGMLPTCSHIIFDEAHNLEDVATENLGAEVSASWLFRAMRKLHHPREESGFLIVLRNRLQDSPSELKADKLISKIEEVIPVFPSLYEALNEFSRQLLQFVEANSAKRGERDYSLKLRLKKGLLDSPGAAGLRIAQENLSIRIKELIRRLKEVSEALVDLKPRELENLLDITTELQAHIQRWEESLTAFEFTMSAEEGAFVYWIEVKESKGFIDWLLKGVPIDVGEELSRLIYDKMETVILTSATLTVDKSFSYLRQRLGLDAHRERLLEVQLDSPFNFASQVLLGIPKDLPLPSEDNFTEAVANHLKDLLVITKGHALVLFTSREAMNKTFDLTQPFLESRGLIAFCQDRSGPRYALTELFKVADKSVLFGTASFWEGIDIPGEALQCLVMVKLPFPVPDEPVIEARGEYLESQGIDARRFYYEPQAIMKFRQGFGRLIRTKTDRGVVLVLDKRLLFRSYGRRFLNSIPRCTFQVATTRELLREISEWL